MWHEARRQERKIRGMLVDYRRRAERRRDFYEKIKADPTQFLQVHGRQCKVHLDPAVASAADNAVMMPWQGQADNLIDRFDVRAHLDFIPNVKKEEDTTVTQEERQLNYERYRIIAQNSFLGISEEKFLKQLHLEEQFGYTEVKGKKDKSGGAAIGFNYEDGTGISQMDMYDRNEGNESDDNSDSDLDVDLAINVSKMDPNEAHEMNRHGHNFGMASNDFYSFLTNDLEEAETYRLAKEEEHEKALFSGRKSRRERRAHREKRLANRVISPPSYAAQASPTHPLFNKSRSPSKSPSPENTGKITYITSFGDEEETPSTSKETYADKVKYGKKRKSPERSVYYSSRSSPGRRSNSRDRKRRRRSRSRSRRRGGRSRSPSRSRRSSSRSRRSRSQTKRSNSRSRSSISLDRYKRSSSRGKYRSYKRRSYSSSSSSSSSSSTSSSSRTSHSPNKQSPKSKAIRGSPSSPAKTSSPPPKVLPRYYGRKRSDQSSSELSEAASDTESTATQSLAAVDSRPSSGNLLGSASVKKPVIVSTAAMTIQERLKRKRQAMLNKQFKADKMAEQIKTEREKQEQQTREDELREMAIKLRKRQREKRHAYERSSSSSGSDNSDENRSKPETEQRSLSSSPKSSGGRESRRRRDDREKEERGREKYRGNSRERRRHYSRDRSREYRRRGSSSPRRGDDRDRKEKRRDDDRDRERRNRLVDY